MVIITPKNKAASHRPHCKGFQNKRTDISRLVNCKKTHFGPYQGISYGFDWYLGVMITAFWAVSRNILCFRPIFMCYYNRINFVTASTFRYHDHNRYRIFILYFIRYEMTLNQKAFYKGKYRFVGKHIASHRSNNPLTLIKQTFAFVNTSLSTTLSLAIYYITRIKLKD